MKKWQIENSETSEISEISGILFRVFLFPSFPICPRAKIENSDLKSSEKNVRVFQVFYLAFIPGSWRKENNHNCLIRQQPLQHGNNPSVVTKKTKEEFREYFPLEGAVNWQWEYCMNQS